MTARAIVAVALVPALLAAGCSIRSSGEVDFGTSPAMVILTFEDRDLGDGLIAPIPVGWAAPDDDFPDIFRPPPNSGLKRDVTLWWVDVSCGGECESRSAAEWEAAVREVEFAQFDDPDAFPVIRRSLSEPGLMLVEAENNFDVVALTVARWEDGASRYLACRASLASRDADLLAAFESECRAVAPPSR